MRLQWPPPGTIKGKAPAGSAAPKKKMGGGTIALIVVGILVVVGIVCVVLGGGTYFASRVLSPSTNKIAATVAGGVTSGLLPSNEPGLGGGTPAPGQTQPSQPAVTTTSGNTPFTTIEGFPADVVFLTDNNGDLSKTTSQGMNIYAYSTNMPYDQVVEFFKTGMAKNGWTSMSETSSGNQQSWTFTQGQNQSRMAMISLSNEGDKTQVTEMLISQ